MIRELIGVGILCVKLAPAFVLLGLGLRYLFYSADSLNLDSLYEKYFNGRRLRKYRVFTQRIGLVLVALGLLYTWVVVWPILQGFFEKGSS